MYDLVGGGFHRYSVDERWLVPHFEKMLYDNALLAATYLHGWLVTGETRFRTVIEETLDYLVRRCACPREALPAQDADTNGVEGLTYSWTPDEVADVLGEQHPEWLQPFEHDRSIVRADVPGEAKERLLATRVKRPQPERDDKVLTGWNGLALGAFAEAGRALGRADYIEEARALGEFLLGPLSEPSGGLLRTYRDGVAKIDAYLEDYANVANGLLELHWATGELRWLERRGVFRPSSSSGSPIPSAAASSSTPATGTVSSHAGRNSTITPLRPGTRWPRSCCFDSGASTATPSSSATRRRSLSSRARVPGAVPSAVGHLLCALDLHFSPPRRSPSSGTGRAARGGTGRLQAEHGLRIRRRADG